MGKLLMILVVHLICINVLAATLPDFSYADAVLSRKQVQNYDRMQIVLQTKDGIKKIERYGRIYDATYTWSAPDDFDRYRHDLKVELLKRAGYRGNIAKRQHFFQTAQKPEHWVYIAVFRDHYDVRYFEEAGYPNTVLFDPAKPYAYSERLKKLGWTVPSNAFIPHIRDFVIVDALYERKAQYRFVTKETNVTARGEVWKLKYAWRGQNRGEVRRYAMLHQFRDLVKARGAQIVFEDASHLVFHAAVSGKTLWGEFGGNDFSASLVLVRESSKPEAEILNVAALKQALDASGHVALKGIYFDTGKATLKPESGAALEAAALLLHRYPDLNLSIEGHTDNVGSADENLRLSLARAKAVKTALIELEVDPSRLKTKGFGETKPVASNDTEAGRATNRRVELRQQGEGGAARRIDAFFFKPVGEAKIIERRSDGYATFEVYEGKTKKRIRGQAVSVRYVLLKNGRRDRSVSAYEIGENMKSTLEALGAKILQCSDESIVFVIRNGDGKHDVYGRLDAAMGAYRIYTITANEVENVVDKNTTKKTVIK
jgi:outer membrane protein OmpA-like peptidoglycan-associated protein/predicted Fe-Mo cluster-binding NifX family protein